MTIIEKVQIRTNLDNLVVWMSDWTRWIEFVTKGYFSTKEIFINGGFVRSDTRIYLNIQTD